MERSIEPDRAGIEHRGGDLIATALAASVLMWAAAYVGLSPAVDAPPLLIAAFAAACLVASGAYLVRKSARGFIGGTKLGLWLGFINFLIVASLHGKDSTAEALRFGAKWIVGFTLVAVALCSFGAWLSSRAGRSPSLPVDWTSRLAVVVAAALLPLLISGGIVTGLDAGLAVPDWLTTFGYPMMFYPLAAMQENPGVYAEHFHRLWGMLVGLSVILLAVQIHRVDRRSWLRLLSIAIILAVIVQGVVGAAWVLDTEKRALAVTHGVFGQLVFAAVAAMAAFASRTWISHGNEDQADLGSGSTSPSPFDVQASIGLFLLLLIQLAFGATYRHVRRQAMDAAAGAHALWAHIILATLLIVVILFVAGRAWGVHREQPVLPRLGKAMLHLLLLQIGLGIAALIAALKRGTSPEPLAWEIAITTAHQAVGAFMLATAGLLAVWSWRLRTTCRGKAAA